MTKPKSRSREPLPQQLQSRSRIVSISPSLKKAGVKKAQNKPLAGQKSSVQQEKDKQNENYIIHTAPLKPLAVPVRRKSKSKLLNFLFSWNKSKLEELATVPKNSFEFEQHSSLPAPADLDNKTKPKTTKNVTADVNVHCNICKEYEPPRIPVHCLENRPWLNQNQLTAFAPTVIQQLPRRSNLKTTTTASSLISSNKNIDLPLVQSPTEKIIQTTRMLTFSPIVTQLEPEPEAELDQESEIEINHKDNSSKILDESYTTDKCKETPAPPPSTSEDGEDAGITKDLEEVQEDIEKIGGEENEIFHQISDSPTNSELILHALLEIESKFQESQQLKQKHATEMKGRNLNRVTAKLKTNTALAKLHAHAQEIVIKNKNNENFDNKKADENYCDSNDTEENDVSNCSSIDGENGGFGNARNNEVKSKLSYKNFNGNGRQCHECQSGSYNSNCSEDTKIYKPNYNTFPNEYYEYENGRIYGVNKDNNSYISNFETPYEHAWSACTVAFDKKEYNSCKAMRNCDDLQRASSNPGITDLIRGLALGYQDPRELGGLVRLGPERDLKYQEKCHFSVKGQYQGPISATAAWVHQNFSSSCDMLAGLPNGSIYQADQNANFKPTHVQTSEPIALSNPNLTYTPRTQNAPNLKVLDRNFNSCTYDYEGLIPAESSPILRVLRNNQCASTSTSTSTNHQNSYLYPVTVTTNVLNSNSNTADSVIHNPTNVLKQKQIEVQIQTETNLTNLSEQIDTSQPLQSASVSKNLGSMINQNSNCNAATSTSAEELAEAHAQQLKAEAPTKTPEDGSGDDDTKETKTKNTASTVPDAEKKKKLTQHSTANSSLSSSNPNPCRPYYSYPFTKSSSVPVSSHNLRTQGPNDKKHPNLNAKNLNSWLREGKKIISTKELPPDINNNTSVIVNVAETQRTKYKDRDRDCSSKMIKIKSKTKKKKSKPTQNQSQNEDVHCCQSRRLTSARSGSRSNQVKFDHARNNNVDSTSRGRRRCRSKILMKEKECVNDEFEDCESNVNVVCCDFCCCDCSCSCTNEPASAQTCCELIQQFADDCQCQSSITSQTRTRIKRLSPSKSSRTLLGYSDEPKGAVGKLKKLNPRLAKTTKNQTDAINTDKGVTAHAKDKSSKVDMKAKNKESLSPSKDGSEVEVNVQLDSNNDGSLSPVSKTSISISGSSGSSIVVNNEEVKTASLPLALDTSDVKSPPEAEASNSSTLLTLLSPEKSSTSIVGTSVNVQGTTTPNAPKLKTLPKIPLKPAPKNITPASIPSPLKSSSPTLSKSNSSSLKTPPEAKVVAPQRQIFKPFCYTRTQSQPPVPVVPVIMPIRNRICRPQDPQRRICAQTEGRLRLQTQTHAYPYTMQCQKQILTLPDAVTLSTKDIQCMILNSTLKRPLERKYCGLNRKLGLSSARLTRSPSWKLKQLEVEQLEREMRSNGCSTTNTATENRGTHSSNHCLAMSTSTSTLCDSACAKTTTVPCAILGNGQYQPQHTFNTCSYQDQDGSSRYRYGSGEKLCAGAKIFLDDTGTEGTPQFLVCETVSGTQLELEVCPLDEDEVEVQVQNDDGNLITPANTLRSNPCQHRPQLHDPGQCHGPNHQIRGRDRCQCPDNLVAEPCCTNRRQQPLSLPHSPNLLAQTHAQALHCNQNVAVTHFSHPPARFQGFRGCSMSPGLTQAPPTMPGTNCNGVANQNQDRGLFIQVPIHLAPKVFQPQLQLQPYPFLGSNSLNNSRPAARTGVPHRSSGSSYENDVDSNTNNNVGLKPKNANAPYLNRFYSPTQQNRNSIDSNKYSDSASSSNNSRFSQRKKQK